MDIHCHIVIQARGFLYSVNIQGSYIGIFNNYVCQNDIEFPMALLDNHVYDNWPATYYPEEFMYACVPIFRRFGTHGP